MKAEGYVSDVSVGEDGSEQGDVVILLSQPMIEDIKNTKWRNKKAYDGKNSP